MLDWDSSYLPGRQAIWDTGRPQQAFYHLAAAGRLTGRVLDAGCGSGEHTLMAAAWGLEAVGLDISPQAVQVSRTKAAERHLPAAFEVRDALSLAGWGASFRTVLDCGLFHCFTEAQRAAYVTGLTAVTQPGGWLYLACYSEWEPGRWGPRRVNRGELHRTFSRGWSVVSVHPKALAVNAGLGRPYARAWLASIQRR